MTSMSNSTDSLIHIYLTQFVTATKGSEKMRLLRSERGVLYELAKYRQQSSVELHRKSTVRRSHVHR